MSVFGGQIRQVITQFIILIQNPSLYFFFLIKTHMAMFLPVKSLDRTNMAFKHLQVINILSQSKEGQPILTL